MPNILERMDDEQRPLRRPSLAAAQSGNAEQFPYAEPSSIGTTLSFVAESRFRASNEPLSSRPGSTAKVAIPRVSNLSEQSSINKRVGHACEPCREQKTKCSGGRPTCQRCHDFGLSCFYGDRKRERTAKSLTQTFPSFFSSVWLTYDGFFNRQLKDLTTQVQEYEQLLNDLQAKLDPDDIQLIQETLSRVGCLLQALARPSYPPFLLPFPCLASCLFPYSLPGNGLT
jgi:Fungal Zn(2)-Cys(6) binuclear cluster domain